MTAAELQAMINKFRLHLTGKAVSDSCKQNEVICTVFYCKWIISGNFICRYKPVDLKYIVGPVREEFETLFRRYFSVQKNVKFLEHIAVSLLFFMIGYICEI